MREDRMKMPKSRIGFLFSAILCCLLVWSTTHAVDQQDDNEPTAENLWEADQSGDLEKAARIKAILDAEAARSWGSPTHEESGSGAPRVVPPIKDDAFLRPPSWGNDVAIATGAVSGGISAEYDINANMYAVRCTTYMGNTNGKVDIYKSTNSGSSWFWINGWQSSAYKYSYPVAITGTSGVPDKLYVFYLRSSNNGDIRVARYNLAGALEGYFNVKADSDTITYFSVCGNFGIASTLMLVYQLEKTVETNSRLYTIRSTDSGEAWGDQLYLSSNGFNPDLGYGYNGYVYMVFTKNPEVGDPDTDIRFCRSTNYGQGWGNFVYLTTDSWDDDFAKVAALHKETVTSQHVWVAYNHDLNNSGNWDLRFAYSTNSGTNWSNNHILAADPDYNEMACDLWVGRKTTYSYVNICYLRARRISLYQGWFDIYWAYSNTDDPATWNYNDDVADYWAALSYDGRQVCQGTYASLAGGGGWSGVAYAGQTYYTNFQGLYFDSRQWTDVEDETAPERFPDQFSLSDNYPNPFNPETRIGYFVPRSCRLKLEIFNVLGQKIRTLLDEDQAAGENEVVWDGRDENGGEAASGVYFYRLTAEESVQTKKMVLIR